MTVGDTALSARAAQVLYAYARAVDESDIEGVPPVSAGTTTR